MATIKKIMAYDAKDYKNLIENMTYHEIEVFNNLKGYNRNDFQDEFQYRAVIVLDLMKFLLEQHLGDYKRLDYQKQFFALYCELIEYRERFIKNGWREKVEI